MSLCCLPASWDMLESGEYQAWKDRLVRSQLLALHYTTVGKSSIIKLPTAFTIHAWPLALGFPQDEQKAAAFYLVSVDNTKLLLEWYHEAAHQRQPTMIRWQIHRQSPQRYSSSHPV